MPTSRDINTVVAQGRQQLIAAARFSLVDILKQAIAAGVPNERQLKVMLEAARAEAIPRAARQQMWTEIGVAAQASLVQGYTSRRLKRPVASYRSGDRFAGALGKALRSESMWMATPFGLYFLNREVLDREAQHWRRLNFGAGAGGKERSILAPGRFPVTGLGMMIGLEPDPRPAFLIPPGFWIGEGALQFPSKERVGQDAFYVGTRSAALAQSAGRRMSKVGMTRGIASRNFLDPAMRRIGREIKPGLDRLWETQRSNIRRSEIIRKKTGRARLPRSLG